MNPITHTIKEREEIFKKFGSIHTDRPMPSGLETFSNIKSHNTQSHIALLESVIKTVEEKKLKEEYFYGEKSAVETLEDVSKELQEALKELKDNK